MKAIRIVLGLLLTAFLAACGGGGGSPGGNPNQPTLFTTAGSAVTVFPSSATTYGISGGVPPYRVQSSEVAVVVAGVSGKNLTIGGVRAGNATVQVSDNAGTLVSISVTVGASSPLVVAAPSSVSIAIGSNAAQNYAIDGGVGPYSATSSNAGVVTAGITGNSLRLTGLVAGSAVVTVRDAAGTTIDVAVTVASTTALFTTAQSSITVAPGAAATRNFLIGGGTGPYLASSSNGGVASTVVSGTNLSITGQSVGAAIVTVRDFAGATVTINVTVASVTNLYTSAPSSVQLSPSSSASYLVGGGVAPYTAASGNPGVVTVSLSGTSLSLSAISPGTATILVRDAAGATQSISVTVSTATGGVTALFTAAPTAVTIAVGAQPTYLVGGGTAPYTAVSSDAASVGASISGTTLSIEGIKVTATAAAAGASVPFAVPVIIRDAIGSTITVNVTVSGAAVLPLYTTAPSPISIPIAVTAAEEDDYQYQIGGGVSPYVINSNNPTVVRAGLASGTTDKLQITGLVAGVGTVIIRDAAGATVSVVVNVQQRSDVLQLLPETLSVAEAYGGSVVLSIFGGTQPYTAFSSDTTLAPVSINNADASTVPRTLTVGVAARCVPSDTDVTLTVIDAAGASATSTMSIVDGTCNTLTSTAGNEVTLITGTGPSEFFASGGVKPYRVESTNPAVVAAVFADQTIGRFTLQGLSAGVTTVNLLDANNTAIQITVTVLTP